MYIVEQINELLNHYSRILRITCSKYNLTYEQGKLILLIPYDGISMSVLSKRLGIDNSTLTRNILIIKNKNIIKIQTSTKDKRKKNIILTSKGQLSVKKIENNINDIFSNINLSIDEKKNIINSIEKVNWQLSNRDE